MGLEDVLVTIKPFPKGAVHGMLSTYASRTHVLKSVDEVLYRVPLDELPGFMSVVKNGLEKGVIGEVYIRSQQEVTYDRQEESEGFMLMREPLTEAYARGAYSL